MFPQLGMTARSSTFVSKCVSVYQHSHNPLTVRVEVNGKVLENVCAPILSTWQRLQDILDAVDNYGVSDLDSEFESVIKGCVQSLGSLEINSEFEKKKSVLRFVICQLKNLLRGKPEFCNETIMLSFMLRNISASGYRFIQQYLILPSISFLNKDNSTYFDRVIARLSPLQRIVVLSFDEIYIKKKINYKNGKLFGYAENMETEEAAEPSAIARTIQALMIQSLYGSMEEIVRLIPVAKQTQSDLAGAILKAIGFLQSKGFTVLACVADGNRLNQATFKHLTSGVNAKSMKWFENPSSNSEKIFVVFDYVHIFKNWRNNWINKKDTKKSLRFPWFDSSEEGPYKNTSFNEVRSLWREQSSSLLRTTHRLSYQALYLSSFDRQRVDLVDALFDYSTIAAMFAAGYQDTSSFMKIVKKWWTIFNVKLHHLSQRKRIDDAKPFSRDSWEADDRISWLKKFLEWLDRWWVDETLDDFKLTRDTHKAIKTSTANLLGIIEYTFTHFPEAEYFLTAKQKTPKILWKLLQDLCRASK